MSKFEDGDDQDDLFGDVNTSVPLLDEPEAGKNSEEVPTKPAERSPFDDDDDDAIANETDNTAENQNASPIVNGAKVSTASSDDQLFEDADDSGAAGGAFASGDTVPKSEKLNSGLLESNGLDTFKGAKPKGDSSEREFIQITISDPQKKGEGMNAFVVYKVTTKTSMGIFKKPEFSVYRRFSDFLGLYQRLAEKHLKHGRIVPIPPEKSVVGMTRVKMSNVETDVSDTTFVRRRAAALERFAHSFFCAARSSVCSVLPSWVDYLNRTATHAILRTDPDFRDFIELDTDLPKATSTSALSGAGIARLFTKAADAVGKLTFHMDEGDQWFEEKHHQLESLETVLRKFYSGVSALSVHRTELATCTSTFAKSDAMLANTEEHTSLSRALSQLADVAERIEHVHHGQAETDLFELAELLKEYVGLIGAIRNSLAEREKIWKQWKDTEATLTNRRETKAKLELAHKTDKVSQIEQEISELEDKVQDGQKQFDNISKAIKKEIEVWEKTRVVDFKSTLLSYLEKLLERQEKIADQWEAFLPEAKSIAA